MATTNTNPAPSLYAVKRGGDISAELHFVVATVTFEGNEGASATVRLLESLPSGNFEIVPELCRVRKGAGGNVTCAFAIQTNDKKPIPTVGTHTGNVAYNSGAVINFSSANANALPVLKGREALDLAVTSITSAPANSQVVVEVAYRIRD